LSLHLRLCVAAALLTLGGWGCGTDPAAKDPEPGTPLPPTVQAIQTAERFGYIRSVDSSIEPATLEFDEAEWLSGEAAQQAAEADGAIQPGDPVPNDYYVRNDDKSTRRLEIAPDAAVTAIRCQLCRDGEPGNLADFLASFSKRGQSYNDDYRGAESQYWLTIEDGRVLAIDEQYRP
jgi:hypothetical protein